jgi:hypothetical protein
MESSEQSSAEAPSDQEKPGRPFPRCCGGDFTRFGWDGEGGSPGRFMADMASPTSGETESRVSCPMPKMCGEMMKGGVRGLGLFLVIPAAMLLSLGAAILLVPQILSWLVAGGLIAAGGLILVAVFTSRRAASAG